MIVKYLLLEDVLYMHHRQLTLYGGADGVRDLGQLESALFRPQTGYYEDLIAEAAALWESMAQNHPFVDGNKRTALSAMHAFLLINGYSLTCGDNDAWPFILELHSKGEFTFDNLDAWLRANKAPL